MDPIHMEPGANPVDTICSKFNIHIFHLEWIFCLNLLCLHDTELTYLEPCSHTDIKSLCNKFRHWLQIGQAMILYTLEMLYMSKESCFYF